MRSRSWRFIARHMVLACAVAAPGWNAWAGCVGDGRSGGILHLDRCDEFESNGIPTSGAKAPATGVFRVAKRP